MISTIQADIIIDGDVTANGDIIVHGQINGNVKARSLKIETEGSVCGNISCQSVVSSGVIKGRIDTLSVNLRVGSDTQSEIDSQTLQVENKAVINANCTVGLQSNFEMPTQDILPDPEEASTTQALNQAALLD